MHKNKSEDILIRKYLHSFMLHFFICISPLNHGINIGIIFCIDEAEVEYFNLGVNPIFRETYVFGNVKIEEKGYYITDSCVRCGTCKKNCPQRCIDEGEPFVIRHKSCLHCGNCYENCPVKAIERR